MKYIRIGLKLSLCHNSYHMNHMTYKDLGLTLTKAESVQP